MNPLDLLNMFTEQVPIFLVMTTLYIISIIVVRVLKKELSQISTYLVRGIAKIFIVSIIPILISTYSSIITATSFVSSLTTITNIQISEPTGSLLLLAIISLGISILLGMAILFIESERFMSPLKIENLNINNLGKIAIKLLNIVPFILSMILVYSILFLAMYPTNMTLIGIILSVSEVYLYIIVFDIIFSTLAAVSDKGSRLNINVEKI
jgi:hypothetical protein